MKQLIRQIGFDDGFFRRSDKETVLIGTVVRGNNLVEGFLFNRVLIDGDEVTDTLVKLINESKFKDTLRVIFSKGITFGGFNVLDIKRLNKETNLPVIVILRKEPDMEKIEEALTYTSNPEKRLSLMKRAGRIYSIERPRGKLLFQKSGIKKKDAKEIIEISIRTGNIPESLRISHLVASAIKLGESRRRA